MTGPTTADAGRRYAFAAIRNQSRTFSPPHHLREARWAPVFVGNRSHGPQHGERGGIGGAPEQQARTRHTAWTAFARKVFAARLALDRDFDSQPSGPSG